MRKLGIGRVTLVALAVSLAWTVPGEARSKKKTDDKPTAKTSAPAARASVANPQSASPRTLRGGPVGPKPARKRRAKRIIRQDAQNQVVLEWMQVARPREVFGPFLPPSEVLFDFPPAPCPPEDVVREAYLHDENPDAPEAQAAEESLAAAEETEPSRTDRLVAVARRLTSLLRPKSASARVTAEDVDLQELLSANLRIPVEGVDAEKLRDSFLDRRGRYRNHLAIDIGAPRGTPVIATADGEIVRMQRERRGGIAIYQKNATGKYLFFYCHLQRYARGLAVGSKVQAGETSSDTSARRAT